MAIRVQGRCPACSVEEAAATNASTEVSRIASAIEASQVARSQTGNEAALLAQQATALSSSVESLRNMMAASFRRIETDPNGIQTLLASYKQERSSLARQLASFAESARRIYETVTTMDADSKALAEQLATAQENWEAALNALTECNAKFCGASSAVVPDNAPKTFQIQTGIAPASE